MRSLCCLLLLLFASTSLGGDLTSPTLRLYEAEGVDFARFFVTPDERFLYVDENATFHTGSSEFELNPSSGAPLTRRDDLYIPTERARRLVASQDRSLFVEGGYRVVGAFFEEPFFSLFRRDFSTGELKHVTTRVMEIEHIGGGEMDSLRFAPNRLAVSISECLSGEIYSVTTDTITLASPVYFVPRGASVCRMPTDAGRIAFPGDPDYVVSLRVVDDNCRLIATRVAPPEPNDPLAVDLLSGARQVFTDPKDRNLIFVVYPDARTLDLWRFSADPEPAITYLTSFSEPGFGSTNLEFHPSGELLAALVNDQVLLYRWELDRMEFTLLDAIPGLPGGLLGMTFAPNGRRLYVGAADAYAVLDLPVEESLAARAVLKAEVPPIASADRNYDAILDVADLIFPAPTLER